VKDENGTSFSKPFIARHLRDFCRTRQFREAKDPRLNIPTSLGAVIWTAHFGFVVLPRCERAVQM
jgi:hypothetical protein